MVLFICKKLQEIFARKQRDKTKRRTVRLWIHQHDGRDHLESNGQGP